MTVFDRAVSLTTQVLGEWDPHSPTNVVLAANIVRRLAESGLLIMDPVEDEDTPVSKPHRRGRPAGPVQS